MRFYRIVGSIMLAGLGAIIARAEDKATSEVLGRGPLHEAYAQPWEKNPGPNQAVDQKPPEPVPEEPPAEKPAGKNVQFIPGYWQWDGDKKDFIWISGMWRETPTERRWVMGYWAESAEGWRWVNGHWADAKEQDHQYVPTPPENPDTGPTKAAPDDNSFYIPGSWFYTEDGYQWRDGYWADYRAGYSWVPARYTWTPFGWSFSSGYWDLGFAARGLVYAPVYFGRGYAFAPGYVYRPSFALNLGFGSWGFGFGAGGSYGFGPGWGFGYGPGFAVVRSSGWGFGFGPGSGFGYGSGWGFGVGSGGGFGFGSGSGWGFGFGGGGAYGYGKGWGFGFGNGGLDFLFVNSARGHYVYGDYFAASHLRAGVTPLVNHAARNFDPVFASERVAHQNDKQWVSNMRANYVARLNGTQPVPPRTLNDQVQLSANGKGNVPTTLRSVDQVRQTGVKLETVSAPQRQVQVQNVQQMVDRSAQMTRTVSREKIATDSVPRIGAGSAGHMGHEFNARSGASVEHGNTMPRMNQGTPVQNFGGAGRPTGGGRASGGGSKGGGH